MLVFEYPGSVSFDPEFSSTPANNVSSISSYGSQMQILLLINL